MHYEHMRVRQTKQLLKAISELVPATTENEMSFGPFSAPILSDNIAGLGDGLIICADLNSHHYTLPELDLAPLIYAGIVASG